MKELSIGQMARLNGLSEQTLRLYDKAGLFSPMYRDAENGYRYYEGPGHVLKGHQGADDPF